MREKRRPHRCGPLSLVGFVVVRRRESIAPAAAATTTVTTAAASAATTAAVTATATTTAAAEATATGALFAGLGFVDGEGAAAVFLAVHRRDRGLGLGVAAHLDESEALGASGVAVVDDLRALDRAV